LPSSRSRGVPMAPAPERLRRAVLAACALLLCATARADIEIEVKGVGEEVRNNVLIFLSLARYRERDDLDADTVQRLHDRVDREVRQALRPFGYHEPKVSAEITPREGGRDWHALVQIDPGEPVVMRQVSVGVTGPGAEDPTIRSIIDASQLHEGARLDHAAYEKLKGDLQRTAVSIGYLDVKLTRHELLVDPTQLTAAAQLAMETGQRYRFGSTTIEQDAVEPALVRKFLRFKEGDYFDTVALLKTQFALDDSQYFSSVEIVPGTRDAEKLIVPVAITAQPARRHRYSIGFGYGTDTRWRGTATWDVRRVNRKGHRARVELVGANTEKSIEGRYVIPVGDPALEKLSLEATAKDEELADLEDELFELGPSLTQIRGRWQRVLFATLSHEITISEAERNEDTLLIPGISFAVLPPTFSGDPLQLTTGLYAELSGSHSAFGSDADFVRLRVRDDHTFDLSERWHLLVRAELGTSFVADFSELPGSQRFFAGGDNSVRGFGLNELSPVDANGEKTGGRHLLVGSVEVVRDLPRNFGVAVFFDAGNAVDKLGDPLEYSAGIGVRWRIPIVTVGIDVAQSISRPGLQPRLHLNISPRL
jgi:translocation and assembly module TamA